MTCAFHIAIALQLDDLTSGPCVVLQVLRDNAASCFSAVLRRWVWSPFRGGGGGGGGGDDRYLLYQWCG